MPEQHFDGSDFEANDFSSIELERRYGPHDELGDVAPDESVVRPSSSEVLQATFEDLSLAQFAGQFIRAPRATLRAFNAILQDRSEQIALPAPSVRAVVLTETPPPAPTLIDLVRQPATTLTTLQAEGLQKVRLGLYLTALLLAIWGSTIMVTSPVRVEAEGLVNGAPLLLIGFVVWLLSEAAVHWFEIKKWAAEKDSLNWLRFFLTLIPIFMIANGIRILLGAAHAPVESVSAVVSIGIQSILIGGLVWVGLLAGVPALSRMAINNPAMFPRWVQETLAARDEKPKKRASDLTEAGLQSLIPAIHPFRVFLFIAAVVLTYITWVGTGENLLQTYAFYAWIASMLLWAGVFAPPGWTPLRSIRVWGTKLRQFHWRQNSIFILGLLGIIILAAVFRLTDLQNLPPEMTSDHVEKLLDSQRVLHGTHQIFFANNGGREPFQMYAMALFSQLPGQSMSLDSLKLLAIIESLLTLPMMVWMGREVVGGENRRLGWIVGFLLAALVAVSYWHTAITRLSLRIILTPLITSLLMIYLARALRGNHRADFIKAGLVLGFGLYTYQAVRMLPVVVVVGVIFAFLKADDWRERWRTIFNLFVLAWISFMVFIPLFHYSVDFPEDFWRRTSGRLLGDDVLQETLADGTIVERQATFGERIEAFNRNVPVLVTNVRNALLMFNWKGDVAWINGAPNQPVMDPMTGGLFIVGLAAWTAWIIKRRGGPVELLIPTMIVIMLLPSALSIAYPIENPSNTRTSGALPAAYLLAAFPLALIIDAISRVLRPSLRLLASAGLCGVILFFAYSANSAAYFGRHRTAYLDASLPYSDAGRVLQGFALSDGGFGNAFMIAYPFWWDHRAVGIEAGLLDWPNGIVTLDDVPRFLKDASERDGRYRFDPTKDILFFYSVNDEATAAQLKTWFPQGRDNRIVSYQRGDDFMIYRVPWLGTEGFDTFLQSANQR